MRCLSHSENSKVRQSKNLGSGGRGLDIEVADVTASR